MIETKTKKKLMWVAGLIGVFVMLIASNAQAQVGIGTTSPEEVLHVDAGNDSLQIDNLDGTGTLLGIDANGKVFKTSVSADGNGIYSGSGSLSGATTVTMGGDALTFTSTGGDFRVNSDLMVDVSANRIGMGTTTPNALLHTSTSSDGQMFHSQNSASSGGRGSWAWLFNDARTDLDNAGFGFRILSNRPNTGTGKIVSVENVDGAALTVQDNGNVGIGDGTPDAKLDVAGSFRLDGTFADKDGDVGTAGQILSSTATGTDWIAAPSVDVVNVTNISAAYTVVAADHAIFNTSTAGSTVAITLPNPASHTGRIIKIINTNSTAGGTVTFAGSHLPQGTISQLNPQASGSVISNGTNWYWYSSF